MSLRDFFNSKWAGLFKFSHNKLSLLVFMFCSGLLAGTVFLGITSSFLLMLNEKVSLQNISIIIWATLPYSLKFIISPYVVRMINQNTYTKNIGPIKGWLLWIQLFICIMFSILGIYSSTSFGIGTDNCCGSFVANTIFASLNVFILVILISIHDILCTHIRLTNFHDKELGFVAAISSTGFRIGMLLGGGGLLYVAHYLEDWKYSFVFIISFVVILCMLSTIILDFDIEIPKHEKNISLGEDKVLKGLNSPIERNKKLRIKQLYYIIIQFCKEQNIFVILTIMIAIKISDASINSTKAMFLLSLGLDKLTIANISQIPSVFALIIGGFVASIFTYKYNINKCLIYTLCLQFIVCLLFLYISIISPRTSVFLVQTTIILGIASLIFGFSNVIFRTFIDKQANKFGERNLQENFKTNGSSKYIRTTNSQGSQTRCHPLQERKYWFQSLWLQNVNISILLSSIGSLFRLVFSSLAMIIVSHSNWRTLYIICTIATLIGVIICYKARQFLK